MFGRSECVMILRGRWFEYSGPGVETPITATAMLHPAYLLRSPGEKRLAWRDLLAIKAWLETHD